MVRQYVFSNRSTRQTALRDCNARNIFYDVTDDPNNAKKKTAFRKKYQRAIVAVNCFLQFAYIKHQEKYNRFLKGLILINVVHYLMFCIGLPGLISILH